MSAHYGVGGRSAATAATADHCAAVLWNPHATKPIYVTQVELFKTVATADHHQLIRTSTRGTTPGSTVTPDIDNHFDRTLAPTSGALLDLAAWSAQPTVQGPPIKRANLGAAVGAGFMWVFGGSGLIVPAGTGLAIGTPVATILQPSDVNFEWDE